MTSPPERADPGRSDEVDDIDEDPREPEIPPVPAASSGDHQRSFFSTPAEVVLAEKPVLEWTKEDWANWMRTAPATVEPKAEPQHAEVAEVEPAEVAEVEPAEVAEVEPAEVAEVEPAEVAEVEPAEVAEEPGPSPESQVEIDAPEETEPQVDSSTVEPDSIEEADPQVEGEAGEVEVEAEAVRRTELPPDAVTELPEEEPDVAGAFAELPEEWSGGEAEELLVAEPPEERVLEPEADPAWWAAASTRADADEAGTPETLVASSNPPPARAVPVPVPMPMPMPVPDGPPPGAARDRSMAAGPGDGGRTVTAPLPPARPPQISVEATQERSHRVRSVLGLMVIAVTVGVLLAGLVTVVTVALSVAVRRAVG